MGTPEETPHTCARCLTRQQIQDLTRKKLVGEGTLLLPATDPEPIPKQLPRPNKPCVHPCVPTVYAFVETVVRRLTQKLGEGGAQDASARVMSALGRMLENYTRLNLIQELDGGNDFSSTDMQIAYIFKYMLSHCNIVRRALSFCGYAFPAPELRHALTQSKIVRAVLIGGGPGSEFLGLLGFLRDCNLMRTSVDACLVDVCAEWSEIQKEAERSARNVGWQRVFVTSLHQNVLEPPCADLRARVRECDVITFVKVVSSLFASRNCEKALVDLLKTTPIGCILLYVDNCAATLSKVMQNAAFKCGYTLTHMHCGEFPTIPFEERPLLERHLGPLMKEWCQPVQTVTPVKVMIFRKVSCDPGLLCRDANELPFIVVKKRKAMSVCRHPLAKAPEVGETPTDEPRKRQKLIGGGSGSMDVVVSPSASGNCVINAPVSVDPNASSNCCQAGSKPDHSQIEMNSAGREIEEGEVRSDGFQSESEKARSPPQHENKPADPATPVKSNEATDGIQVKGAAAEEVPKAYVVTETNRAGVVVKRFSGGCEIGVRFATGVVPPERGSKHEQRKEDESERSKAQWIEQISANCVWRADPVRDEELPTGQGN